MADKPLPDIVDLEVDHDRCEGHGLCIEFAPGVFGRTARNQSEVIDPLGGDAEEILDAAANCPTMAVIIRDPETGEDIDP